MGLTWYHTHTVFSSCFLCSTCLIASFVSSIIWPQRLSSQFIVFSQSWSLLSHACLAQLPQIIYYQWNDKAEGKKKNGKPSVMLYRLCVFLDLLVHGPTAWAKLSFLHTRWNPVIHYILVLFLKGATLSNPTSNYRMYYFLFFKSAFALCTAKETNDLHGLYCILCIHLFSSVQNFM